MPIILDGSNLTFEPVLLSRLPEVKRTQPILKFVISIVLIIHFISFITVIHSLSIRYETSNYEVIRILFWILMFASGMFISERYYHNGLVVFAWFGILNIVVTCIIIVFETVGFVITTIEASEGTTKMPVTVFPIYTCLTSVILDAVVVILAFKLSYFIAENKESMDHQQI